MARLLLPAVLFAACAPSEEEALCEHKALHDADGSIDGCDFDACVACEESCDDSCITLEMTGSNYQCTTGESWSAVDFCPRWAAQ